MTAKAKQKKRDWIARSIAEAAGVIGVSGRRLSEFLARGCPGGPGKYPLPEIIGWCKENIWKPRPASQSADDPLLVGSNSPALEKYREQKAAQETIKTARMQGEYIPIETAREFVAAISANLKSAADRLEEQFGPAARKLMESALEDIFTAADRHLENTDA